MMTSIARLILVGAFVICAIGCSRSDESPTEQAAAPAPASAEQVSAGTASAEVAVGQPAPLWEMSDLEGKKVALADYRGKKGVLLVFFATWCPACMQEVPELIKFREKYKDRQIEIVGAALDQPAHVIRRFAETSKVNYKLVLDSRGLVAKTYGVTGIPMNIGIDASGIIRYMAHELPADPDSLVKQMETGASQ